MLGGCDVVAPLEGLLCLEDAHTELNEEALALEAPLVLQAVEDCAWGGGCQVGSRLGQKGLAGLVVGSELRGLGQKPFGLLVVPLLEEAFALGHEGVEFSLLAEPLGAKFLDEFRGVGWWLGLAG